MYKQTTIRSKEKRSAWAGGRFNQVDYIAKTLNGTEQGWSATTCVCLIDADTFASLTVLKFPE